MIAYVAETHLPEVVEAGAETLIKIDSSKPITNYGLQKLLPQVKHLAQIIDAPSVEEGLKWLKENYSG